MSALAIDVRGLRRTYGPLEAVAGVDLQVGFGEVFALLGPNGAGKTTTTEILEGYRERSGGEIRVLGVDPADAGPAHRARVGIVLQSTGVDPHLTVRETLAMYAGYYPSPRDVDEVLALVGLDRPATRVRRLSGGQQRRLDVAVALVGDPDLLFLDEPTTGFDPGARRAAWDMVRNLAAIGKTVFLTTHFMDEAQAVASRVAVIAHGRIVAEGPPATLGGRDVAETTIRFRSVATPPVAGASRRPDGTWELRTPDQARALHVLTALALGAGEPLDGLEVHRPTLEDVYLALTGEEAGE